MRYFRFFFGTPRRLMVSLVAVVILAGIEFFFPGNITVALVAAGAAVLTAVVRLLNGFLGPLAFAVLPLIIVGIGFRIMMRGFGGGRGGRRRR